MKKLLQRINPDKDFCLKLMMKLQLFHTVKLNKHVIRKQIKLRFKFASFPFFAWFAYVLIFSDLLSSCNSVIVYILKTYGNFYHVTPRCFVFQTNRKHSKMHLREILMQRLLCTTYDYAELAY